MPKPNVRDPNREIISVKRPDGTRVRMYRDDFERQQAVAPQTTPRPAQVLPTPPAPLIASSVEERLTDGDAVEVRELSVESLSGYSIELPAGFGLTGADVAKCRQRIALQS